MKKLLRKVLSKSTSSYDVPPLDESDYINFDDKKQKRFRSKSESLVQVAPPSAENSE